MTLDEQLLKLWPRKLGTIHPVGPVIGDENAENRRMVKELVEEREARIAEEQSAHEQIADLLLPLVGTDDGTSVGAARKAAQRIAELERQLGINQPPRMHMGHEICGEPAGDLIAGASWFACLLPKGHEPSLDEWAVNGHLRGGTCFKHGEYVGEKCPLWPDCIAGGLAKGEKL